MKPCGWQGCGPFHPVSGLGWSSPALAAGFPSVEGNTRVGDDSVLFWTNAARAQIAQYAADLHVVRGSGGMQLSTDPAGVPFAQYVDDALGRGEHVLVADETPRPEVGSSATQPIVRVFSFKNNRSILPSFEVFPTLKNMANSGDVTPLPVYAEPNWFLALPNSIQLALISLGIGGAGYALYRWTR